jgi:flavin reductase
MKVSDVMAFDQTEQRRIMGHFATGITIVTTKIEQELHGMTANAVTSLSLDPSLVLVAVDLKAGMHESLRQSEGFALNILSQAQESLSNRFATRGPKDFSDIPCMDSATGSPVFTEALAWVDCRMSEILSGGDHDIFIGEIIAGDANDGEPLLYFGGKYRSLR